MLTSPLTISGFLIMELRRRAAHARTNPDRGASAVEWVIITGLLVAIAVAVGIAITSMVTDSANELDMPAVPGGGGGGGGGGNP